MKDARKDSKIMFSVNHYLPLQALTGLIDDHSHSFAVQNPVETVEKVFLKIIGFSAMISSYLFQE